MLICIDMADSRKLGRNVKGFASVDRALTELDHLGKRVGVDLTRPSTVEYGKTIDVSDGPVNITSAYRPAFEGSLTIPERTVLTGGNIYLPDSSLPEQIYNDVKKIKGTLGSIQEVDNPIPLYAPHGFRLDRTYDSDVHKQVEHEVQKAQNDPEFHESLHRVRDHLRSPQLQNMISHIQQHSPRDRMGGRFASVYDWQRGLDHIDLKTGNWAEFDPEGFFPE